MGRLVTRLIAIMGIKKKYEVLVNPILLQLRAPGMYPTGVASVTQRNGGL